MGMGTGALAVIGGTVVIIGFLTLSTGALIAVQGYNTLSNVGIEALTGFLGAFLNVRFIAPATAGVALAATIGAGATAQIGAMRINEEIDALEVMGIRAITYLASTRIVAGVIAVIPIYTVAVLMSFLATRFGTTVIYGQSRGVYDHYFSTFLQPTDLLWSFVEALAMAAAVMAVHTYYGLHRDRRPGRRRRGGRPRGTHLDHRRRFHPVDHHAVRVRAVRQLPPVGVTAEWTNSPRRGKIDPIWWAPVLFVCDRGTDHADRPAVLRNAAELRPAHAGLRQGRPGHGERRQGEVARCPDRRSRHPSAPKPVGRTVLEADTEDRPGPFQYLPSNVEAEIKSSTAFGAKYVDLIVPRRRRARSRCKPGAVLHSRNVTVEVNTVFQNLQSVVHVHRPGEAELGAVGGGRIAARQGRRHRAGDHRREQRAARGQPEDADRSAGLAVVRSDHPGVFGCGAEHPVDPRLVLDDQHHHQPTTRRRSTACCCPRSASPSAGINTIGGNQPNLVRAMNILDPTTASADEVLADLHLPVPGAQWFLENGGTRCDWAATENR